MYNNYYFLKKLANELQTRLPGTRLEHCYTQSRQELTLSFSSQLHIRAHLLPTFSILLFPAELHRARKNTADLFEYLLGKKVLSVEVIHYDRSFIISLEDEYDLLFKMHGSRCNVIVLHSGKSVELFKGGLVNDKEIEKNALGRPFPSKDEFIRMEGNVRKVFPVLGREYIEHLETGEYLEADVEVKWSLFLELHEQLENAEYAYILDPDSSPALSLLPLSTTHLKYSSVREASNAFFRRKIKVASFDAVKKKLVTAKSQKLQKTLSYIQKGRNKLEGLKGDDLHKYTADVIMANIHWLKTRKEKLKVPGFMGDELVVDLTKKGATDLAEQHYRKSKNRKIEIDKLEENIREKETQYSRLKKELEEIEASTERNELESFEKAIKNDSKQVREEDTGYHELEVDGFIVRIGKNAKNNDRLTFGNGFKEDMWLHVKDTPGSHVLVKYRSDRKFPKNVIHRAAELAAWYSKRKTEGVVPVIVTPRKFVRKRKGDPPGAVVVDKEEVLLVEPKGW